MDVVDDPHTHVAVLALVYLSDYVKPGKQISLGENTYVCIHALPSVGKGKHLKWHLTFMWRILGLPFAFIGGAQHDMSGDSPFQH